MFDVKWIRENPEVFDKGMKRRGLEPLSEQIIDLDIRHRTALTDLQEMQKRRNELSKKISFLKKEGEDAEIQIHEVGAIKRSMSETEEIVSTLSDEIEDLLIEIPNTPDEDVPDGEDEEDNVEVRKVGEPKTFDFKPKLHDELGVSLGLMDFENAAKISGSRFVILKGALARLEKALARFMLDTHTDENGFTEMYTPVLVKDEAMYGTGQLPKFASESFKTENGYWLISTSEITLANMAANHVSKESELPMRFCAYSQCFRSEAGAAGKDTRGMMRQHQFGKVELVSIVKPEDSKAEHEKITKCAEEILEKLGLAYRTVVLCTGDLGFGSHKTYDIEVWLPGEKRYREISSCSNCGDFQSHRMNARFKTDGVKGSKYVHTLNGSGLAVGRTLIAVLENYQREDGSIEIPKVLVPYMGGMEVIPANG
ncbi:MAG: serine--tRNA ligase [Alphaproteobacteria bacterium]|nr:serine--tRNA ligase [Alphaproteobacteria bacterium]